MEGAQSPNLYSIHIEGRFDISVIWAFGRSPVLRSLIFRHRGNPIKISKQKQAYIPSSDNASRRGLIVQVVTRSNVRARFRGKHQVVFLTVHQFADGGGRSLDRREDTLWSDESASDGRRAVLVFPSIESTSTFYTGYRQVPGLK